MSSTHAIKLLTTRAVGCGSRIAIVVLTFLLLTCLTLGCRKPLPLPKRRNDYNLDIRGMQRYLRSHGINNAKLIWSIEGPWSMDVSGSSISNLDWTLGIQIDVLIIDDTLVQDLSPLGKQHSLRWLQANNTQVYDLSPLSEIKVFETLEIKNTAVSNLEPLKESKLYYLDIRGTPCDDISLIPLTCLRRVRFTVHKDRPMKGLGRLQNHGQVLINDYMDHDDFWQELDKSLSITSSNTPTGAHER